MRFVNRVVLFIIIRRPCAPSARATSSPSYQIRGTDCEAAKVASVVVRLLGLVAGVPEGLGRSKIGSTRHGMANFLKQTTLCEYYESSGKGSKEPRRKCRRSNKGPTCL